MIDNLEWYRVFYCVARTGSLSKAADELHITQPAVSHSIKQLESKLGGPLFFRLSRGVKLTAEGEALFGYIEQAYHLIGAGERKLAEMRRLLEGEIKIGAGDTLCKHYLLPYLKTFHHTYPGVNIQVTNRTTPETIRLLKDGRIDFGIVHLPVNDKRLRIRESSPIQDCFVAGPAHRFLAEAPVPLSRLLEHPILLLEQGTSTRDYLDSYARRHGVAIKPEIELGSLDLLAQFAQSGFGIACVVKNFVAGELARSELYEIRVEPPIPPRSIGIVSLTDVPLSAAAARFIETLP